MLRTLTICCAVWLVAGIAAESAAQSRATRFILEGGGGIGLTDNAEFATWAGGTLGYGGKFRGFPVRFYLITSVMWDRTSTSMENSISYADRTATDLSWLAGPRLYIPLGRRVRLHMAGEVGGAWSRSRWSVNDLERYEPNDTSFVARFSGGVQVRFLRALSVGVTLDRMLFWGKRNDPSVAAMVGFSQEVQEGDRVRLGLTGTLHF